MSAMSPHIRVLRALAAEFDAVDRENEFGPELDGYAAMQAVVLRRAADALEAEERELNARISGIPPREG